MRLQLLQNMISYCEIIMFGRFFYYYYCLNHSTKFKMNSSGANHIFHSMHETIRHACADGIWCHTVGPKWNRRWLEVVQVMRTIVFYWVNVQQILEKHRPEVIPRTFGYLILYTNIMKWISYSSYHLLLFDTFRTGSCLACHA